MVKKEEFYFPSVAAPVQIHGISWCAEGEIKGVVQLVHGMVEFIDRYHEFACFLAQRGFYVVGHDHIGHGKSICSEDDWGYFAKENGPDKVLADMLALTHRTKELYPTVPYYILGHSMGSFFVRKYAYLYGELVDGVIVMGTGNQRKCLLKGGKAISKVMGVLFGERHRSKLLATIMFGSYNRRIPNVRTSCDWLSKDEFIVDKYMKNPANRFLFTVNGIQGLVSTIDDVASKKNVKQTRKDLPLLLVSGQDDPVGEYGKAVKRVEQLYKSVGLTNVTLKLFLNDRHEILNETDRQEVYEYLYHWILTQMSRSE